MHINENLAFDVGAYTGDTISAIKSMGYKQIVCFEPSPGNYAALMSNYGNDPAIIKIQKAVSDTSNKQVEMIINNDLPWLNTLDTNWIYGCRHESLFSNTHKIIISTVSLDDYIKSIDSIPSYIKIDVEGHTLNVFKGLSYKPNMISFEWVSEFAEMNAACLIMTYKLGFNKFYISIHENTKRQDSSIDLETCLNQLRDIRMKDNKNEMWGNIWCFN
jgi:FkbM family methyltransferase